MYIKKLETKRKQENHHHGPVFFSIIWNHHLSKGKPIEKYKLCGCYYKIRISKKKFQKKSRQVGVIVKWGQQKVFQMKSRQEVLHWNLDTNHHATKLRKDGKPMFLHKWLIIRGDNFWYNPSSIHEVSGFGLNLNGYGT